MYRISNPARTLPCCGSLCTVCKSCVFVHSTFLLCSFSIDGLTDSTCNRVAPRMRGVILISGLQGSAS